MNETEEEKTLYTHIDNLELEGRINSSLFEDERTFSKIKEDYQKENKENYNIQAEIQRLADKEISTIQNLYDNKSEENQRQKEQDRDSSIAFSFDNSQKMFGEAFSTIGDATGIESLTNWGQSIVDQQEIDIKEGGYKSSYNGSFTEQSAGDMIGWTLEAIMENSVTALGTIGGGIAAIVTAPVSATGAAVIGGVTATGTILAGIGEVSGELKQKKVYSEDKALQAIAIGTISGAVDLIGMGKVLSGLKKAIIRQSIKDGVIDTAADDIKKSLLKTGGALILSEGLMEVAQEGAIIANAASEGAEYEDKEIINRFIDSFVVGAAMGGAIGAPAGAISGGMKMNNEMGITNNAVNISKATQKQQVLDSEIRGSFSGGSIKGLSESQLRRLAADTVRTEAPRIKGKYDQTGHNKHGYQGLYQFGASALTDVGLIKKSAYDKAPRSVKNGTNQQDWLNDPKNWTSKGGLNEFLKSREMQDKAFTDLAKRNIKTAIKKGAIDPNNPSDVAAFIKASHLVGAGNAVKYFKTGKDKRDGNGTAASKYAQDARAAIQGDTTTRTKYRQQTAQTRARTITDSSNSKHDFKYKVVEADTINPSVAKASNQQRDRTRDSLKKQVDEISKNLDYDLVSSSPTLSDGAPVISIEGKVIAGNGRFLGIDGAYKTGKADEYKRRIIEDAEILGLDPTEVSKLKKPVLIRQLSNEVDNESLAIASNQTGTAKVSELEQSAIDSTLIGDISQIKVEENGRLSKSSEINMLQSLIKNTPTSQHNAITDADGNISKEGKKRVQSAILYNAYGETSTLQALIESTSESNLNILNGLSQGAPAIAEMNAMIDQGLLYDAKINKDLSDAVKIISSISSKKGETIESWIKQRDMLDQTPESTIMIVKELSKRKNSPKKIKDFLLEFSQKLKQKGSPTQEGIFSKKEVTTESILKEDVNTIYKGDNKKEKQTDSKEGRSAAGGKGDKGGKKPPPKKTKPNWTPPEGGASANDLADSNISGIDKFIKTIKSITDRNLRSTTETLGAASQNLLERTSSKIDGEYAKWKTKKTIQQMNEVKKQYNGVVPFEHNLALKQLLSGNEPKNKKILNDKKFQKLATLAEKMRADIDSQSILISEMVIGDANNLIKKSQKDNTQPDLSFDELINLRDRNKAHKKNNPDDKPLINQKTEDQINLAETILKDIGKYNSRTYAIHRSENWEVKILNSGGEFKKRRASAIQFFIDKINSKPHKLTAKQVGIEAKKRMVSLVKANGKIRTAMNENSGFQAGEVINNKKKDKEINGSRALRELLGEYTDPIAAYEHTMEILIKARGIKEFHKEFKKIVADEGLDIRSEPDQSGLLVQIRTKEGGLTNPYEGQWTTPVIADYINRSTMQESDDWKAAIRVNSLWQATHTVYSVPTVASNIISILPVMMATSSLKGRSVIDATRAMGMMFGSKELSSNQAGKWQKTYGFDHKDMMDFMAENQISHGGAVGGEAAKYLSESGESWVGKNFDSLFSDEFKGTGIDIQGKIPKTRKAIGTAGINTKEGFEKMYNFGDSLPKVLIFINEVQRLSEIKKISNSSISKNEILEAAAHLAKQQAPQYSRVPKIVDMIRKFPTMGQFVAFKAQLYQTTSNMARMNFALLRPNQNSKFIKEHFKIDLDNIQDQANKQKVISTLKARGASKSAAMVATLTTFGTVTNSIVESIMGDDSEPPEDMDAVNALMPDYYRLSNKQYVGRDENGVMEFVNTARLNMYGDLGASLKVIDLYSNGKIESGGQATRMLLDSIMSPFYEPTFIAKLTKATSENKDSYNKAIIADEDGLIGNAGNVAAYLAREIIENGTSKVIKELYDDMFSEEEANKLTGYKHSSANAALTAAGIATIKFDPNKQMAYWFHRTKSKDRSMRSRLSGKLKSYSKLEDSDISESIKSAKQQHDIIYTEMIEKIKSARAIGVDEDSILQAINLSASGKKIFQKYLSNEQLPPFLLEKMGETQVKQSNFKNLSNDAKITFLENYDSARRILNNTIWE